MVRNRGRRVVQATFRSYFLGPCVPSSQFRPHVAKLGAIVKLAKRVEVVEAAANRIFR